MKKLFLAGCFLTVGVLSVYGDIRASKVSWTFPRVDSCHEGLPFSDGVMGVLVWGGGDTIRLTVGRGDLWDHRGGYYWLDTQNYAHIVKLFRAGDMDGLKQLFARKTPEGEPRNPYMLPLGRVEIRLNGAELAQGELDTATGLGRLVLSNGQAIDLAMSKESRVFALHFPVGLAYDAKTIPSMEQRQSRGALTRLGFLPAKTWEKGSAFGFTWNLPADKPVALACNRTEEALFIGTSRTALVDAIAPVDGFAGVVDDSRRYWAAFWREGARVAVPDVALQQTFDLGMYRFGAMTDPDGVPAGLQGQWLEDDKLVPWNGDYHFNINVQECYSPAYRGGHFRNLMPMFQMVLSWRARLRENAKRFVGVDNGYVLPHSVDDRGVCIGGYWVGTIDHGSTAWIASMMMRYVRYSGDMAFLRNGAYDFMCGAMNVYRAMMEEDPDGKLSFPIGSSPEWDIGAPVGRNPSFQLAAAHRLANDLVDAANRLGETPDPMWADVLRRLPVCNVGANGEMMIFDGQALVESHRHHSHMAGFYPFDVIPMDETNKDVVSHSYRTWIFRGMGGWSGWAFPWASILQTHAGNAAAAVWTLNAWNRFFTNPGHGSRHDVYRPGLSVMRRGKNAWSLGVEGDEPGAEVMQMDGQCASVTAIMELLAHDVNGRVEFFRGCPNDWKDVRFENLALSDGRRVSGSRIDGKISIQEETK